MSLRKAAEMALKYLENSSPETDTLVEVEPHVWEYRGSLVIQALRQALAQPDEVLTEREACAALCSATAAGRDAEAIEEAIRARSEK